MFSIEINRLAIQLNIIHVGKIFDFFIKEFLESFLMWQLLCILLKLWQLRQVQQLTSESQKPPKKIEFKC